MKERRISKLLKLLLENNVIDFNQFKDRKKDVDKEKNSSSTTRDRINKFLNKVLSDDYLNSVLGLNNPKSITLKIHKSILNSKDVVTFEELIKDFSHLVVNYIINDYSHVDITNELKKLTDNDPIMYTLKNFLKVRLEPVCEESVVSNEARKILKPYLDFDRPKEEKLRVINSYGNIYTNSLFKNYLNKLKSALE